MALGGPMDPPPPPPMTADHQQVIGEVVALGRTEGGAWAVAVCDRPLEVHQPVSFSPTIDARRDGTDGRILGLAVTLSTA